MGLLLRLLLRQLRRLRRLRRRLILLPWCWVVGAGGAVPGPLAAWTSTRYRFDGGRIKGLLEGLAAIGR